MAVDYSIPFSLRSTLPAVTRHAQATSAAVEEGTAMTAQAITVSIASPPHAGIAPSRKTRGDARASG